MNKELFVSSTPHETKVGMVEDDLLAEIYLERENEYTLAGSIYKGRVTRVLLACNPPLSTSAWSATPSCTFPTLWSWKSTMKMLTDIVPAGRGVQDMRQQPAQASGAHEIEGTDVAETAGTPDAASSHEFEEVDETAGNQPTLATAGSSEPASGRDSQDRERGGWRGRRRRRGGRRDGRGDNRDRAAEPRVAAPVIESVPEPPPAITRPTESRRTQQFGPPAGYQPIILPGESISKYRGLTPAVPQSPQGHEDRTFEDRKSAHEDRIEAAEPVAATFPDDEPIFASPVVGGRAEVPQQFLNRSLSSVRMRSRSRKNQ